MKTLKKALSLFLALMLVCAAVPPLALASGEATAPLYVSFGDSITNGAYEDYDRQPDYNQLRDRYTSLFAAYLGAEHVTFSAPGMQTGDILYCLDDEYKSAVDSGDIELKRYSPNSYPPRNGVSIETVRETVAAADYISVCAGSCDYYILPSQTYHAAIADDPSIRALGKQLMTYLEDGTIDKETYNVLSQLLDAGGNRSIALLNFVFDAIGAFSAYLENYPKIIKALRELNPDATIILLGNYLNGSRFSFITETDDSSQILFVLNRMLDSMNFLVKKTAVKYDCVYVDTMGIESVSHPTKVGYQQICDRMISVLEGDTTYAGNVAVSNTVIDKFVSDVRAYAGDAVIDPSSQEFRQKLLDFKAFSNSVLSAFLKVFSSFFSILGRFSFGK